MTSKLPIMLINEYGNPVNHNNTSSHSTSSHSHSNSNGGVNQTEDNTSMLLERGGLFHGYSSDLHMNSLTKIWNFTSTSDCYSSYDPCLSFEQSTTPVHLIILQHGFQGTSYDMRLIRNALHMEFPHYLVSVVLIILFILILILFILIFNSF